jgi:hypothetical protein
VPMYDLMGKDATMFHHEQGDDPSGTGGQFRPGAGLVRQHVGHRQPQPPMTARTLRQIIGGTRHLLLDFDGPICSVYAPHHGIVSRLRVGPGCEDVLLMRCSGLVSHAQEEDVRV